MFAKIQKNPENPENVESGSKIRIRIPEIFWPKIFLKFDFKGGLWSKICRKNDFLLEFQAYKLSKIYDLTSILIIITCYFYIMELIHNVGGIWYHMV